MHSLYRSCHGTGLIKKKHEKQVKIPAFIEHDTVLNFENEGHHSHFSDKG
jgi:DnaJ-class molecular chaperone